MTGVIANRRFRPPAAARNYNSITLSPGRLGGGFLFAESRL